MPTTDQLEQALVDQFSWPQPTALDIEDRESLTTDLVVNDDGHLEMATGHVEVLNALYLRTVAQKGDWPFDLDFGLPWLFHSRMGGDWFPILGMRNPDFQYLETALVEEWGKDGRFDHAYAMDIGWRDEALREVGIEAGVTATLQPGDVDAGKIRLRIPLERL